MLIFHSDSHGTPLYKVRRLQRFIKKTQAMYHYTCLAKHCKRSFNSLERMKHHVKLHKKFRPFKCPHCPKSYTQRGNMRKHLLIHSKPDIDTRRKHIWQFCNKGYTEKYNLKVFSSLYVEIGSPTNFSQGRTWSSPKWGSQEWRIMKKDNNFIL